MKTLCVILARAGSKGLPGKNAALVAGRPMLLWTVGHALEAGEGVLDHVVLSTDGEALAELGREAGIEVIKRPESLATDTATVDSAARHAVEVVETARGETFDAVVILYANIPVRPGDLIGRAVAKLVKTGCDSVQSVAPVGKNHPYWMKTLGGGGGDELNHYQENNIYRRQELPEVYQLDGGIIAVTRASLFTVAEGEPHAFLGEDRRAVKTEAGAVVDVDEEKDLMLAEAVLGEVVEFSDEVDVEFVIGERLIGENQPAYVIAEIGVNHDGELGKALELTRLAKEVGADAVKFQLFKARDLLSAEAELAGYQEGAATDPYELLDGLQLGVEEMLEVRGLAKELGLGFIVTPFSLGDVERLERLDVDAVKIASPDCVNEPLLKKVRGLGKPLIISTGAAEWGELETMDSRGLLDDAVMLQCVSSYPVPSGQIGLSGIVKLCELGEGLVGYSDHTEEVGTGALAVCFGACVLERHLTYDQEAAGPDHAASLDGDGFENYVQLIREAEAGLVSGCVGGAKEMQACEADVRRVSRQSLCAVRDLVAGDVITADDLTVKRPGTGIAAARLDEAIGCLVKKDVRANYLLHEGDIQWG